MTFTCMLCYTINILCIRNQSSTAYREKFYQFKEIIIRRIYDSKNMPVDYISVTRIKYALRFLNKCEL